MSRKKRTAHLTVPNKLASLAQISAFLNMKMKNLGMGQEKIAEVQVAVDEAFTNMIQHSNCDNHKGKIEIYCSRANGYFKVEIKNYGVPFNPIITKIKPDLTSDLNERSVGGLGIHFIKNLMDDLNYEYSESDDYEILTMIKYV